MLLKLSHLLNGTLLIVILSCLMPVSAQSLQKQDWAMGEIILNTGDTLVGPISYYHNKDLVQVTLADGEILIYSPVNVKCFKVFNGDKGIIQTYKPFNWSEEGQVNSYKKLTFFEVLAEGKYTLINRSVFTIRNLDPVPAYTSMGRYYEPYKTNGAYYKGDTYQIAKLNLFYLLTPENNFIPLKNPKKDMENIFQEKEESMEAYINKHNLSYKNPVALLQMVRYLNRL
ncbi:hypothetical protein [Adhaeribacter aquaticus]|uniref:hypothetical protein n=1 Tax=Adhaeribacter aquaticus TaxID=299567 RepID=UPI00047D7E42|nr:hypothetical protein [Adhaeribacter aquaticus]